MTGDVMVPQQVADPTDREAHASTTVGKGDGPGEAGLSLAVIRSKVQAPLLRDATLERPRLLGWLDQHATERVVLISAEVGYGKSTLLADFARRTDVRSLWYRLESSDRDWMSLLSHLVAAVREVQPGFGGATEALLRHVAAVGPSRDMVLSSFLAELGDLLPVRTFAIFDDFHLVDGSQDVRVIMRRLIESAPRDWHFFIAGRGRPNLPLGRVAASGLLGELTTQDLRFTRSELEGLFGTAYAQHLSKEALDIVEERTEGWAASLQLVAASIAASRPSQVETFIGALSGAKGSIYDFLAEEVLDRLSPVTQRVLIHSSLLDGVTPRLVSAALSGSGDPVAIDDVTACLREAESLGLFSTRQGSASSVRFHPLLKEFLEHQLVEQASGHDIARMHVAVAEAAADSDWLVAGKHYAMAGRTDDAMRVLGAAAHQALGTGSWGAATEIITLMPDVPPPPAVQVIRARALIAEGRAGEALTILDGLGQSVREPGMLALVSLTRATALHSSGQAEAVEQELNSVVAASSTTPLLRKLAEAWQVMIRANQGDSIAVTCDSFRSLADDLLRLGLSHYAGVALHNAASGELARANYTRALVLARDAAGQLDCGHARSEIFPSTLMIQAAATAELGSLDVALSIANSAVASQSPTADALAEASYLAAVTGDVALAESLIGRFERGDAPGFGELGAQSQAHFARIAIWFAQADYEQVIKSLDELRQLGPTEVDGYARTALMQAMVSVITEAADAQQLASEALRVARVQQAWRWGARARIVEAVSRRDGRSLAQWIGEGLAGSHLAVLESADVIATCMDLLDPLPEPLAASVSKSRSRWLPVLRRETLREGSAAAPFCALALSKLGSIEDARVLRAYERARPQARRRRGLATQLVRRLSATVRVHDLGPTTYDVGGRIIQVTETRRKAASLLLYLVTRPRQTAAREQVMEQLWPDQSPRSAINSLHQTLFFLRRDLECWYEDGLTRDYVRLEADLIYLDPEMFQIDSVAFHRQASEILALRAAGARGPEMLRLYTGTFAPEFEYEAWAEEWRSQLHTMYLHLAQATSEDLVRSGKTAEAANILAGVVQVEPLAFDLRCRLIRALAATGAGDAALAHYQGLSLAYKREMGIPMPTYAEIAGGSAELE